MDVVVANSLFTAGPIFHFHSTQLYNFITGNGLFSAYPEMTCNLQDLFNPRRFTLKQFAPALLPASVRLAIMKYVQRGPTRFRHKAEPGFLTRRTAPLLLGQYKLSSNVPKCRGQRLFICHISTPR
jgi:hypothetical protein